MIRQFFLKRLKKYMLITTLPLFVVVLFFSGFILDMTVQKKKTELQHTLTQINENLNLVIENSLYQNNLLSLNPSLALSFRRLLMNDEYNYQDYLSLHSNLAMIKSIANSHNYIESITLYLDGGKKVFNSQNNISRIQDFYDSVCLELYASMPEERDLYIINRAVSQYNFAEPKEIISVFQRLSYMRGVAIVNIDAAIFRKTLESFSSSKAEKISLFDSDGNAILWPLEGKENEEWNSEVETLIQDYHKIPDVSFRKNHRSWNMIGISYNDNFDLYLISALSVTAVLWTALPYLAGIWTLYLGIMIAVWVIAYITTKRNFEQIAYYIEVLDQAEKGNIDVPDSVKEKDEYDLILNNVLRLFLRTTFLNAQLEQQKYMAEAAELKALQLQINPHFLFNTLQTLNLESMRQSRGYTGVNKIIDSLSDILKYSLESTDTPVTLREEIDALKKYVTIQKYRFGNKFTMYYEIEEELMELPFLRLLLQPLIENSISHGIQPLEGDGLIKLKIYSRRGYLFVYVTDSGIGMSREERNALLLRIEDQNSRNIGLTNVNRRLVLHYGKECHLSIWSKQGMGSCIHFCIPMEKIKKETETSL